MNSIYSQPLSLLNDFYQMTMSYGYWKSGLSRKEAVFHLFFRRAPFHGGFTIAAGLEAVIHFIKNFKFDNSDLSYLAQLTGNDDRPLFENAFLDYLSNLKFTGHIDAIPEGSVVFPYEPLLRIQAPLIECQLLESPLLNLINFPTLIATKAARMCLAANGDPILEFGLRRAQGIDGALTASRAAYIGGCDATSNLLAGKIFNIPVKGTHAHSWIMVFADELEAFQTYASILPNNCIFLVDTYNTIQGVKNAITVGKWLKNNGKKLLGIRLDSGDLAELSIKSRKLLDEAGFSDAIIVASNELDETIISELKRQGAQINMWGVGTNLVTGKDQATLDGVYKLSAIRDVGAKWSYKLKLSEQMVKISNPGILQVKRFFTTHGNIADVIYDVDTTVEDNHDWHIVDPLDHTHVRMIQRGISSKILLEPICRNGLFIYENPSLQQIRQYRQEEMSYLHAGMRRFLNPEKYFVGMEKSLYDLKIELIRCIRAQNSL